MGYQVEITRCSSMVPRRRLLNSICKGLSLIVVMICVLCLAHQATPTANVFAGARDSLLGMFGGGTEEVLMEEGETVDQCVQRVQDRVMRAAWNFHRAERVKKSTQDIIVPPPLRDSDNSIAENKKCYNYVKMSQLKFPVVPDILKQATEPGSQEITFVTQTSATPWRIEGIKRVMQNWRGPVSVAIYVYVHEVSTLAQQMCSDEAFMARDNLGIHLVLVDGEAYPTNYLRNVALNETRTEYVFLSDGDFLPVVTAYDILVDYISKGVLEYQLAMVLPAFEVLNTSSTFVYPTGKQQLEAYWDSGEIIPFHWTVFKRGHEATDFDKFRSSDKPYKIEWQYDFEPYVVMKKKDIPIYTTTLIGRYKDKISQIMEIAARGFRFVVLHNAFTMHMPHKRDTDKTYYRCALRVNDIFEHYITRTYPEFQFTPVGI